MKEWNAEPRRGSAACPAPSPVHPKQVGLFRLRFVDRRVGGGVDHDVRARRFEPRKNRSAVGKMNAGRPSAATSALIPARSSSDVATWPFEPVTAIRIIGTVPVRP